MIKHIQTDWLNRIHVRVDSEASTINCFAVTLPPYFNDPGLIVTQRAGKSMEETWQEALATVMFLRQQPVRPIAAPDEFNPFGYVTACNFADALRDREIQREMMIGGCFDSEEVLKRREQFPLPSEPEFQEMRVEALIKAWHLLDAAIRGEPLAQPELSPWH